MTYHQAVAFFREHAGYSYNPSTETPAQGRLRCARSLASAELRAKREGIRFYWDRDHDSGGDEWQCLAFVDDYDTIPGSHGEKVLASLGGIDLGDDDPFPYGVGCLGQPTGKNGRAPYCRVVEAELALEALGRVS